MRIRIRMRIHRVVTAFLLALLLSGCGRKDGKPSGAGKPERFYSTSTAATCLLLRLGAGNRLAAIGRYSRIVPGAKRIPVAGSGSSVSLETLAALGVNRAFVWHYQTGLKQRLERRGIKVTAIPAVRLAGYPELVRMVAAAAGKSKEGEVLIAEFRKSLKQAAATSQTTGRRPRVYFELYSPFRCAGGNSYLGDLLELAGGDNIETAVSVSGPVDPEWVIRSAPEVILFMKDATTREAIARRPGFARLPAVREGRIFAVDRAKVLEGADPSESAKYLRGLLTPPAKAKAR